MSKDGYILNVVPGLRATSAAIDCNKTPTHTSFYATAQPEVVGATGSRGFAATTTSSVWQDTTGVPPREPIVAGGTVSVVGK